MINKDITAQLENLTHTQLDKLKESLDRKIKQKEEARRSVVKTPPRNSNDLNKLAEAAGLDISSLLKEIGKGR